MALTSVSNKWAIMVARTLEAAGLDAADIFRQAEVDYGKIENEEPSYSPDEISRVWMTASQVSGKEAIGLNMSKIKLFDAFGTLSYSMLASNNLKDAVDRLIRYQKIFGDSTKVALEMEDRGARIILDTDAYELPPAHQGFDGVLAIFVDQARWLSKGTKGPLEIEFNRSEPKDLETYQTFFQCPLKFSAPRYSVLVSHEDFNQPFSTSNEVIAEAHDRLIQGILEKMGKNSLAEAVKEQIIEQLPEGEPPLKQIAEHFNVSSRTLQRRLKAEGYNYQSLMEEVRQKLALDYVLNSSLSVQRIAYLLGFSEHSNFNRAFKRWFGKSPSAFRSEA